MLLSRKLFIRTRPSTSPSSDYWCFEQEETCNFYLWLPEEACLCVCGLGIFCRPLSMFFPGFCCSSCHLKYWSFCLTCLRHFISIAQLALWLLLCSSPYRSTTRLTTLLEFHGGRWFYGKLKMWTRWKIWGYVPSQRVGSSNFWIMIDECWLLAILR